VLALREEQPPHGAWAGSAAGLLLTYLLGITHVDPLRFDLSMDRFMTPDRIASGKLPDIDQDLPSRDLLVGEDGASGWLKERFGPWP
jgi:error-prone DNA polymerase